MQAPATPVKISLTQVRSRRLFKVTSIHQIEKLTLTLSGVYRVATAKADHGRIVKILDVASTRITALGTFESGPVINVPMDQARSIEVYLI